MSKAVSRGQALQISALATGPTTFSASRLSKRRPRRLKLTLLTYRWPNLVSKMVQPARTFTSEPSVSVSSSAPTKLAPNCACNTGINPRASTFVSLWSQSPIRTATWPSSRLSMTTLVCGCTVTTAAPSASGVAAAASCSSARASSPRHLVASPFLSLWTLSLAL